MNDNLDYINKIKRELDIIKNSVDTENWTGLKGRYDAYHTKIIDLLDKIE